MKKAYSAVLCVLLCFALSFGVFAESAELKTVVPSAHEITVVYNEGGSIIYKGEKVESGEILTVNRFDDVILSVLSTGETHLKTVTVNGKDVTQDVIYGRLILASVHTNMEVVFTFENCHGGHDVDPDNPDPDKPDPDKPNPDNPDPDNPNPDNPNPDNPDNPDDKDKCTHISMSGGIFRDTTPIPGAKLEFDYGEAVISADKDGKYSVDDIKDGYHIVKILNADGTAAGDSEFAIYITSEETETHVITTDDGMQVIVVPKGTGKVYLDFIVHGNSGKPGDIELKITDPPKDPVKNPIIADTGIFIRENPVLASAIFVLTITFFVFLVIFFKRRKDDEKEETEAMNA